MLIEVDFNSDEAIYIQLCNQIILGIAMSDIQEGDSLPSVRQLADTVGVNMHTVNKAYHVLKQEGYISLDKRRGAVIAVDVDKLQQLEAMKEQLRIVLAPTLYMKSAYISPLCLSTSLLPVLVQLILVKYLIYQPMNLLP